MRSLGRYLVAECSAGKPVGGKLLNDVVHNSPDILTQDATLNPSPMCIFPHNTTVTKF